MNDEELTPIETIKQCYPFWRNQEKVKKLVLKGKITIDEYKEITGEDYKE